MSSTLEQFRERAFACPGVTAAYEDLDEAFARLGQALEARAEAGLAPPAAD
jgi:hypothetical protein